MCAKNYQNITRFDKVIEKIKRVQFLPHCVVFLTSSFITMRHLAVASHTVRAHAGCPKTYGARLGPVPLERGRG